ncbi:MAG: hypothetical protein ACTSRG_18660 [Candidatus Helarchaeota archaeon]
MPEKSEGTVILSVRISKHINTKLKNLVKEKKFPSKADIMRTAIIEFLTIHEEDLK